MNTLFKEAAESEDRIGDRDNEYRKDMIDARARVNRKRMKLLQDPTIRERIEALKSRSSK